MTIFHQIFLNFSLQFQMTSEVKSSVTVTYSIKNYPPPLILLGRF